jgi:uracil-DNA glycosylase family 4
MSDPTRFDLDERQRAMLAEMGVRVWWPQHPAEAALPEQTAGPAPGPLHAQAVDAPVHRSVAHAPQVSPSPAAQPVAPAVRTASPIPLAPSKPSPAPGAAPTVPAFPPLPDGLPGMAWADLQTAAKGCASCALCAARKTPILGSTHAPARWMVVGDLPSEEDDDQGTPFNGPEGRLLDNMLQAVGVCRLGADVAALDQTLPQAYLTHAVKCRPPRGRNPELAELTVCASYLSRQVALVQPQVILAMGRFAIQSLLGSTEPVGKLRGRLHDFQGVPVVVTYDLANLLRQPDNKAKAWADLVLGLQVAKP